MKGYPPSKSARCKWGTFELNKEIHVAPCTVAGYLCVGHHLSRLCACYPTQDANTQLWIHHEQ